MNPSQSALEDACANHQVALYECTSARDAYYSALEDANRALRMQLTVSGYGDPGESDDWGHRDAAFDLYISTQPEVVAARAAWRSSVSTVSSTRKLLDAAQEFYFLNDPASSI